MWHGIFGHDEVVQHFRRTLESGRLASTYLFVGPPGIGKRRFGIELAHSLLCTESPETALEPCGRCESCRLFANGSHPDFFLLGLPPDKSSLPIAKFIGDDQHRNQQGLCHDIALKPFYGRRRIAIVDDADHFNIQSANCLLKTLEEPPPSALLILIGTSPARQLPTIRSRSQIVRFQPLDADTVARILVDNKLVADEQHAARAAELSDGSVERALELADPELWKFREQLLMEINASTLESVRMGRSVQAFVDEAGKESTARRKRLRIIIGFALNFHRDELSRRSGAELEQSIQALDASLAALEQVDRNANLGLVIQHWCEELAAARGLKATSPLLSPV